MFRLFLKSLIGTLLISTLFIKPMVANEMHLTNCTTNTGFDIELQLFQENQSPEQYNSYKVVATISNTGDEHARNIVVDFSRPEGVVYVGADPFNVSRGSFFPHYTEEWTIDALAPGASATLSVNYFLLAESAPIAYAELTFVGGQDIDSTPGNGTPPFPNEDDEASTINGQNTALPDLKITNLQVQNPVIRRGEILNYTLGLSNIGLGNANNEFSVRSWISKDITLSNDDTQDGVIPTGNFLAGFGVQNVPGASTISQGVEPGEYYLIVKIDGYNQINESDETNNIEVFAITIEQEPTNNPQNCSSDLMTGTLHCTSINANNDLEVVTNDNGTFIRNTVNAFNQIDSEIIGNETPVTRFEFSQDKLIKRVDNVIEYEIPVPNLFLNNFEYPRSVIEIDGGFLVLAFKNTFDDDSLLDELFAVRTDANLIPISSNNIAAGGTNRGTSVTSPIKLPNNKFTFILAQGEFPFSKYSRLTIDMELNLIHEDFLANERIGAPIFISMGLSPLGCGNYEISTSKGDYNGGPSYNISGIYTLENNDFVLQSSILESLSGSGISGGTQSARYTTTTSDGSVFSARNSQEVGPNAMGTDPNVTIEKRSADGVVIWERIVQFTDPSVIQKMISVGDKVYLIVQQSSGVELIDIECLMNTPEENMGTDISLDVDLSSSRSPIYTAYQTTLYLFNEGDETATNLVIDFPEPEGVVYSGGNEFETTRGSFSPYGDQKWRVDALSPGEEAELSINYFIIKDQVISHYAQIESMDQNDTDSSPGNGICCTAEEDDEISANLLVTSSNTSNAIAVDDLPSYPIELRSLSPNPTFAGHIKANMYSQEKVSKTLNCYNALGNLEYSFDVNLEAGWNEISLDVSKLVAGTYIMHLSGVNWRQKPIRLVVVRD